jgi:energy-coupling factor transporter ATP-binding protein EcfA2
MHFCHQNLIRDICISLGGPGGCGKSRLIETISAFMHHRDQLYILRSVAPSSAAAVAINSLTIQSMLHERHNKTAINPMLTQTDIRGVP